jgi:2-methylfumaryl-CoA hydratase
VFAGYTIFAWSEVLARAEIEGRGDIGALRLRTVATKNRACLDFPYKAGDATFDPSVVLDLDYWVVMPR